MKIENNIIKHHLKNVYFICGNACAGKTTMAKALSEKHGFLLYDMDKHYDNHRKIAHKTFQAQMCYHLMDFHTQYTRPTEEQVHWSMSALEEQTEMVVMDLIKLSANRKVVADVLFSHNYLEGIVDEKQIVFLTVGKDQIRKSYFDRPEKRSFYEYVKKQTLSASYFEHIYLFLERVNEIENDYIKKSGFKFIERYEHSTLEENLALVESHFAL